ncbi:MAG: hypothetical protein IJ075_04855 [Lachnospiraceae bacterium]|nr:hypothetical protein [Lachnospiraceae bacterium]
MDRDRRHKRVVRQRILAIIFTLLVLAVITFGLFMGIKYLNDTGVFERKAEPETEAASEEPAEEASETDDSWIAVEKEEIVDDYADVDTSVLSEDEVPTEEPEPESDEEIESIISNLDMEEKVAQLFIVTPEEITGMTTVTRAGDTTKDALTLYPVGGLIYFAQNFEDPDQTKEMLANTTQYITDACGIAPFLATDEEGGRVARLAENEAFELENVGPMADIGKLDDTKASDEAYNAGAAIGKYMSELGFNLDFAPVADVLTSKSSEAIGDRSFGSDPELVSKLSYQFASGLQESGIIPCYKHFPGHGSVAGDTHETTVAIEKTKEELETSDLIPFRNAVENDAPMIMASQLSCPEITGDDTPTSLSSVMLTDILRDEMGYNGIIITDSFQMGAVTQVYPDSGDAAVAAIKAGADIVLMPADFNEAYHAVLSAASSGEIEEQRIDDSLRRILIVKLGRD